MRQEEFNNSGSCNRPSENMPLSIESPQAGVAGDNAAMANFAPGCRKAGRGKWTRRSMVSCLLGSLLLALAMLVAPAKSSAQFSVVVSFGPPAIPVYVQPYCPGPGFFWTPGYWAWDPDYGYYWVPGTWVLAPFVGALWTPGYWGWYNDGYVWYPGYWGTAVGFYGGIDYGFGYPGQGYYGGYWNNDRFFYNRQVTRISNVNIVNVYSQRVVVNESGSRTSYNGGPGGIDARPTAADRVAERGRRFGAINQQLDQERVARSNPAQRARENHGRPEIAATAKPGEFRGNGVVRATRAGGPYKEPPRQVRNGREAGRSQPAPVERAPKGNAPRQATPSQRMERGAPAQPRNERPANRNNAPATVQRNQGQSRPAAAPPSEGRGKQERPANPPKGEHEKGNDHNPGRGR
jgi:WXXGXW repeat (2 copies)